MAASDSVDEADSGQSQIGASVQLALKSLQIVDLASVCRYLASIGHWQHRVRDRPNIESRLTPGRSAVATRTAILEDSARFMERSRMTEVAGRAFRFAGSSAERRRAALPWIASSRNPQQWCHAVPAPGNAHRDYRSREAPEQCTRRTLRQELRVRRLLATARAPRPTTPPVGCARCGSARIVDSDSASSPGTRAAFPSVRQEKRSVSPARGHAACASRRISRAWPSPDRRHAWHPAQQLGRRTLQAGHGQGEVLQIARRPERTGDVPRSVARLPIARTRKTRYP